jgi:hypothetical protein
MHPLLYGSNGRESVVQAHRQRVINRRYLLLKNVGTNVDTACCFEEDRLRSPENKQRKHDYKSM